MLLSRRLFAALPAFALLIAPTVLFAQGFGSVTGEVFYDEEDLPELDPLVKKGSPGIKDAAVCAADAVPNQKLIIDEDTGGIKNVFVYVRTIDPASIHPDLKEPKEKTLVFDQKGCVFKPHALVVRTGQTVLVKSDDPILHNIHTWPLKNDGKNFAVPPNERDGVPIDAGVSKSEILPIRVTCDVHPWMVSYWLILDHPYAAITDDEGRFTIENLPAGEHELRFWHESAGYIAKEMVTIEADETIELLEDDAIAADPDDFDLD